MKVASAKGLNKVISRLKLGSLGMTALVFIAGLWYWTYVDTMPKNATIPSGHIPSVPPMAQQAQGDPRPTAGGNNLQQNLSVSGSLNWGMYTGTMQDQVQKALTDRNGPMAANLAAMLHECFLTSQLHAFNSSRGRISTGDPAIEAVHNARLQEENRQISACQAVVGDQQQVRLQLLNVAIEQKVFGAADISFQAGVRTADVLKLLVRDAREGSLGSLFQVATYNPALFGIDADTQSAVRYALKIASTDPTVGSRVARLLEHSEFLSPGYIDEKSSTYDYSKMSDAARKEGAEIGARLVKQLKKSTS